jgi:hypothetical protein
VLYLRSGRNFLSLILDLSVETKRMRLVAIAAAASLFTLPCPAQEEPPAGQTLNSQSTQKQAEVKSTVTIPAGTRIALVLTQPIQSRYIHRGDDIFAQVLSPVDAGNQVVIPAGTFV